MSDEQKNINAPFEDTTLKVRLISGNAIAPTPGAVGYDLRASSSAVIPARGHAVVDTDVAVAIPKGFYGRIGGRFKMAKNSGIVVGQGAVDSKCRDGIEVLLFNHSDNNYTVGQGDRIASLILERTIQPDVEVCKTLPA